MTRGEEPPDSDRFNMDARADGDARVYQAGRDMNIGTHNHQAALRFEKATAFHAASRYFLTAMLSARIQHEPNRHLHTDLMPGPLLVPAFNSIGAAADACTAAYSQLEPLCDETLNTALQAVINSLRTGMSATCVAIHPGYLQVHPPSLHAHFHEALRTFPTPDAQRTITEAFLAMFRLAAGLES